MHLPFTFATGEAMLYQTGYPLHGFTDPLQGKAKGSKSKKGKMDKGSSEDLDPKSLLGALMSQDESVYVCQPDTEPKMSYHGSLFGEQQGNGERGSLHVMPDGEAGRCSSKPPSYDPLLATLDSLTLDGEETCSNSELFSALENLGLNAEDLELLLLDERMIQVELDPNHIPTLSDLLTNNEILSYLHDTLENGAEGEKQRDAGGFGVNPDSAQSVSQQPQACLTPAAPPPLPSVRQPIIQLSQQMQQHISASELPRAPLQQLQPVAQPGTVISKILTGPPNGQWVEAPEHQPLFSDHIHHLPQTFLKSSPLNGELKRPSSRLEPGQAWQLQQDQHSDQFPSHQQASSQSTPLPGFQDPLGPTTNGSYISNGHAAFPPNVEVSHAGYGIPPAPNGVTSADVCRYPSYQLQPQKHQQQMVQQAPPPCLPQCPTQSSALELEQFLGLSQPSLEAYSVYSTQDSTHSKVRGRSAAVSLCVEEFRLLITEHGVSVVKGSCPIYLALPLHSSNVRPSVSCRASSVCSHHEAASPPQNCRGS